MPPRLLFTLLLLLVPAGAAAQVCAANRAGLCDEPYLGTGLCPLNSDPADCAGLEVLWDSAATRLSPEQIFEWHPEHLRLARNEIFARHGRIFQSPDLAAFFALRSWYSPTAAEVTLTKLEAANVATLLAEEEARAAALPHASGLPRPRASFTATVVYEDGTRHAVEQRDGDERHQTSGGDFEADRLFFSDRREIWDLRPAEGMVVVYSAWYEPALLLRQPALLAQLLPVLEGEETIAGEPALRFRLAHEDDWGASWHGLVWVTPDGIVLKGDVAYRAFDGDEPYDGVARFELQDLRRGPVDPARLERPTGLQVNFAG